jgi:transglutaminase-like putative cysteine protease
MLSNFFYSQSLLTALCMLVSLLGLLTALVLSHMPVGKPPLMHAARISGDMALLGAPIMAILFVLFPRIAPLWGVPSDAMSGRSGLSASMQVGNIASLALDSSIAFRVHFEGEPPPQNALYFRGPVLSTFDGREWRPLKSMLLPNDQLRADLEVTGNALRYEVTLEPTRQPWLLLLDAAQRPPELSAMQSQMTPDLQWFASQPVNDLLRYKAQSYTSFRHGPQQAATGLRDYLRVPAGFNPRTQQLGTDLRNNPRLARDGPSAMVSEVLKMLRNGGYTYTLEPGIFGTHSADEFWFERKQGFCEHIASSFVLLMRAAGIPARVVTGYQGGERNDVDGYWTVRQSDAHAWAEVWLEGRGWVRVDPTSSVAPGRTGTYERLAAPTNAFTQVLVNVSPEFAAQLRATWEAVNNRWNQWVLNYSQAKQMNLLRNLGFESPSWEDLGYVLSGLVVAAGLLGALWTLWERYQQDPWLRLLARATRRLQRAGLLVPPNTPPRQLAALLQTQVNSGADIRPIQEWLLQLESWRYSAGTRGALGTLRSSYRVLRWPRQLS